MRNDEIGQVAGAFNVMTARVGEMIDDREQLLADVSHELRSPIARMKVALEFMPEGGKRESLARDLVEMEKLIAVLLEREALRSRASRLDTEEVDLDALTGSVVATFADQGPGVEFVSSGTVTIPVDPAMIKLLVQNLIDNAVKFSRPDSRPIGVRLEPAATEVVLRIADDGIGIPDGTEEHLRVLTGFQAANRGLEISSGLVYPNSDDYARPVSVRESVRCRSAANLLPKTPNR